MMDTPSTLSTNDDAKEIPDIAAPTDIKMFLLAGLLLLALLAACYAAAEIILPIVLAFVLRLVLQPAMRLLENLHLPRLIAALVTIIVLCGSFVGLRAALSGPAASWAQKLPAGLPRLEERLTFLSRPIQTLQQFLHHAESLTQPGGPAVPTVAVRAPA